MSVATTAEDTAAREAVRARTVRRARRGTLRTHAFLSVVALLWLFPIVYALYTSLGPYSDTATPGYVSIAHHLSLVNFKNAWNQADLPHYYLNSLIITVPAIVITLILASFVAFGCRASGGSST